PTNRRGPALRSGGAALSVYLSLPSPQPYRAALFQLSVYLYFYWVVVLGVYELQQTFRSLFAHVLLRHMNGRQRRGHVFAQRQVVEADDRDILRYPVSGAYKGAHGSDGDEVVVREISRCQLLAGLDDSLHVRVCSLLGRGKLVDDGFGGGHAVIADGVV